MPSRASCATGCPLPSGRSTARTWSTLFGQAFLAQPKTLVSAQTFLDTATAALECPPTLLEPDTLPAQATRSILRAGATILAVSRTLSRGYSRLIGALRDVVLAVNGPAFHRRHSSTIYDQGCSARADGLSSVHLGCGRPV